MTATRTSKKKKIKAKNNRFNKQNKKLCTCITLFCTFLYRFTPWKCLISRFKENVNKQRRNFISLSELAYGPLEFNFRRVRLHLTTYVGRNSRGEDRKNANSLFKRLSRCPRVRGSYLRTVRGSFIVLRIIYYISKGFRDVAFLSKKTRKSNRLQKSLERQQLSPQLFKNPECWSGWCLNRRPPAWQTGAY